MGEGGEEPYQQALYELSVESLLVTILYFIELYFVIFTWCEDVKP